jgi:cyclin-dependent kinase 7
MIDDGDAQEEEDEKHVYKKVKVLGMGASGKVVLAVRESDSMRVAIKKVFAGTTCSDGVNPSGLREIKVLRESAHENVIDLVDVYVKKRNIYLVMELMYADLEHLIRAEHNVLSAGHIKCILHQLLSGVDYLHRRCHVMHRDLKPANCLVDSRGTVKLTDFGLARTYGSPRCRYTPEVATIWYRAPELLFGARQYTSAIDMWSVGCIFAELMLRNPYLPGETELGMLGLMCAALGTPTEAEWPGLCSLPGYVPFEVVPAPPLSGTFTAADEHALDLLSRMLTYDPAQRISAADALRHRYFRESPAPSRPDELPLPSKSLSDTATPLDIEPPPPSRLRDTTSTSSVRAKLF